MLHGSHLMIGVGTFLVLSPVVGVPLTALGLFAAVLGSLIPDIDHPKSFISHWNAFTEMISEGLSTVTSHRGFTHTVYGLSIWLFLVGFVLNYFHMSIFGPVLFGAAAGYLSHLVIDSLNPQGVRWMGKEGGVHLKGPIDTGGKLEKYLMPVLFIGLAVLYLRLTGKINSF